MAEGKGNKMLRILCLHGYRQNAKAFRERTGAFRKIIKNRADLVFIDAPNQVPPMENVEDQTPDQKGWWFSRQDDYFNATEQANCIKGYKDSLLVIEQTFREQGPFDGVLGFSQGAAMVALLCGEMQRNPDGPFQFKFAIMVASFISKSIEHQELFKEPITIPTLHVYGETDKVISGEMSEELLGSFREPTILQHKGGHFIPATSQQKKVYLEFLDKMKQSTS
ncbi:unnamed protein product [Owenia fusiformis]|uniref:Uncharacterized protein n=1 Tax=Owenia fusiformis TaxID=6347 RepID=A0A8J1TCE8_OWEFU|nr:unnamed protein product [Owenia fusiformis]